MQYILFALPFYLFTGTEKIKKETILHCWLVCLNCESNKKRNIEVYVYGNVEGLNKPKIVFFRSLARKCVRL